MLNYNALRRRKKTLIIKKGTKRKERITIRLRPARGLPETPIKEKKSQQKFSKKRSPQRRDLKKKGRLWKPQRGPEG